MNNHLIVWLLFGKLYILKKPVVTIQKERVMARCEGEKLYPSFETWIQLEKLV